MNCVLVVHSAGVYKAAFDNQGIYEVNAQGYSVAQTLGGTQVRIKALPCEIRKVIRALEVTQ
jgi:hypothetical protein